MSSVGWWLPYIQGMTGRGGAIVFRLVFAAAALGAVGFQLFGIHIPKGHSVFNFFTYFTNLSNILISIVFIVTAVRLMRPGFVPTRTDTAIRGAAVVYIAFVGLVFNTLLTDVNLGDLNPTVNIILHFILPIAGIVDWIIWPPQNRLPFTTTLWWMIWPAVYAIFSVVRGSIDGVYPYPFFNPEESGGYGGVALYCAAMVVGFFVLALGVWAIGNWRYSRSVTRHR